MEIHYFQRYHTKENVDTSNTMLMLSRLYNYSPDKFFSMLNEYLFESTDTPEIKFNLQETGKGSVPDAVISQKSFKIVVETKLDNKFREEQLLNHLNSFGREEMKVLLTVDPRPMDADFKAKFEAKLKQFNKENQEMLFGPIKHCNLTFKQLLQMMSDVIDSRDSEMVSVLQDYSRYCYEQKLIPDEERLMRAIVSGTTIHDNMELNLFYDKASRKFSPHAYIGLYDQKSIRGVGKIVKKVSVVEVNGKLKYTLLEGEPVTSDERERIQEAIARSDNYGYDLRNEAHIYFLVDNFYPIDFKKDSPYPIQKAKYFNLGDMFNYDEMPDTKVIAENLDGKTWEDKSFIK